MHALNIYLYLFKICTKQNYADLKLKALLSSFKQGKHLTQLSYLKA